MKPFQRGVNWEVRDGMSTLFWLDTWLIDEPLVNQITADIPSTLRDKEVRFFWNPIGG